MRAIERTTQFKRGGRLIDGAVRALAKVLDMIAPAPPTRGQAERMERAAEEQAQHNAQAAEDAERKELLDQLARDRRRREEDYLALRLADQLRRDLETRGRETDHSRGRERER
jgi:5'-deoxynucleotidase YfbR-like HD superfamily hydrolase